MKLTLLLSTSTALLFVPAAQADPPPLPLEPVTVPVFVPEPPATIQLARELAHVKAKLRMRGRIIRTLRHSLKAHTIQGSLLPAFMCVHYGEGAWNSATGNGYYGGLQMDYGFMSTYGRPLLGHLGTADRWPPAAQVAVATIAFYSGRGFAPWPNTARYCGLL